ncbi:EthD domain-containing protein [Streptomyces sp. NBC_01320]|uniref:EthD domain-containing protein n=1 Tax=Streptomyces sp. NBC_01320 TaxID=2903824 RepID=UPI002E16100F|nr:EthD domain-containing protein [Streptomyces sp. NBC_01320]
MSSQRVSLVLLLKRKPGISMEEFRQHYDNVHAKMAEKCFDHVYDRYSRNFITADPDLWATGEEVNEAPYDAVTVISFLSMEGLEEMQRLVQEPEQFKAFLDDENSFLDQSSRISFLCEESVS